MLTNFASLALVIAATAFNANKNAYNILRFLKLGCNIIASLLIKTYRNISDFKQKHPSLADKFISFWNKINLPRNNLSFLGFINKKSF
jgi:hypothetical protein